MMTPRERVTAALTHRQPDMAPWTVELTKVEREKLVAHTGDADIHARFGSHITGTGFGSMEEIPGRPSYYADHFGVVWNRTVDRDIGVVEGRLLPEAEVKRIPDLMPAIDEAETATRFEWLMRQPRELFRLADLGFSLFERAWTLRGMDSLLMDMADEPEFVEALLGAITDWNLKCIDIALQYDIDAMLFGDDWGMQRGLIMGPRMWRKFIKPCLARMYGRVKSAGRFVLQHSCGDISGIYPDLVEIGLDAHQTFQPEIYDIHEIKRLYKGKLSFWGGISTQRLLPFAPPDVVRSETARIIGVMGKGGGFIAAPTHAIPPDVPPENVLAMVEVFQNQRKWVKYS